MRTTKDTLDIGVIIAGSCMASIGVDRWIEATKKPEHCSDEYKVRNIGLSILGIAFFAYGTCSFFRRSN